MEQPKILVAIRKRPLSKKEQLRGQNDIVTVKNIDTVIVSQYKQKVDLTKYLQETIFNFDFAFNEETVNEEIYDTAVRPLVDSAFQGAKVTCFAYGQTGSGKTFTMNGNINMGVRGLYTLGAEDIFSYLSNPQYRHLKAKLAFFQIYCGKLYDLLHKRKELLLREDNKGNINIVGLQQTNIECAEQFTQYLQLGGKQRVTSMNSANADSSRSHAILQISLKDGKKLFGKISFIDLAGNQRGADHMDMGKQTKIDGAQINKSLLSLKECIRALDQGSKHTPFRGSKLTMVLRDSFIGFCRTVMIGNVSPSSASSENTLNTLRYADRVKQLRKPAQNMTKEEQRAKQMMLPRQNKNAIRIAINNDDDAEDIARKREEAQREYGVPQDSFKLQPSRQESNIRKNSYGGKNLPSTNKIQVKSSSNSLAKNGLGRPLNNPNIPQLPINTSKNASYVDKRPQGAQSSRTAQIPGSLSRYNSHQPPNLKREQFMQIQSSSSPYYMPNKYVTSQRNLHINNSNQSVKSNSNQVPPSPNSFHQEANLNLNERIDNRYANDPRRNNYVSQQQFYDNNMVNSQPLRSSTNFPPGYQQQPQFQQNYQYNKYQQNNYSHQHPQNQLHHQNYPQNYGYPQNQPFSYNQPEQIQYQFPQQWEQLVTMANPNDPNLSSALMNEIQHRIKYQQEELLCNYNDTITWQLQMLKQDHKLVKNPQYSGQELIKFIEESIDEKISKLQEMREKLNNFRYKHDCKKEIEQTLQEAQIHHDDEQLLDDIN